MLADVIEPTIRSIAHLIVRSGAPISGAWKDYNCFEDLLPLKQTADDNLHFIRSKDHSARVEAFNIHAVDPDQESIEFHDPVVQRSESKATASVEIDNRTGLTPQSYLFRKSFAVGQREEAAVKAGFSLTSKTTIGTGQSSPYSFSQEFSATVSSEWSSKTGRSKDSVTGGEFPLVALPGTKVRGFLAWDEQDMIRHVSCFGTYDFGIKIGRRAKRRKKWRWHSGAHQWESLDDLIATAAGRGSVHFPLHEFWGKNPPLGYLVFEIRQRPRVPIDQYIPYKGAANIRVVIETLDVVRSSTR